MLSLSQDKKIVPATSIEATLPIQPVQYSTLHSPGAQSMSESQVHRQKPTLPAHSLMSIKSNKIILPGESLELDMTIPDQTVIVEGWLPHHWPDPQLVSISQGKLQVTNNTTEPVLFDNKKVKSLKIMTTEHTDWTQPFLSTIKQEKRNASPLSDSKTIDTIKISDTTRDITELLQAAHRCFSKVFSKDLSGGYNGHYGRHECHLNWATAQRPEARKIPIANYNHGLKGIMQEVCDELTQQ